MQHRRNPKAAWTSNVLCYSLLALADAGHYVPNLAWTVVQGNQAAGGKGQPGYLNLAGIMVGNPWTDASVDNKGTRLTQRWHVYTQLAPCQTAPALWASMYQNLVFFHQQHRMDQIGCVLVEEARGKVLERPG
eukprot:1159307-Pelagomonas_calceolata.AAC.4